MPVPEPISLEKDQTAKKSSASSGLRTLKPGRKSGPPRFKAKDQSLIEDLQDQIRARVRQSGTKKEQRLLEKAFAEISRFHANQVRRSGQPVIVHPLRVSLQICKSGLEASTAIAALLHDAIEDTSMTREHIREEYGDWYAEIVEGLTKIKYPFDALQRNRSELEATYQRMLIAMTKDVRAMFIKMFDRLDNMRDMEAMPRDKQRRISRETLDVYVPMARRLGLTKISQEHTELCFRYLYPKRYLKTVQAIEQIKGQRMPAIEVMRASLEKTMEEHRLAFFSVAPVLVHPAAMVYDSSPVDRILESIRIVVESRLACYQALGILHTSFSTVPLQIRDYISNPLWNGYQGIQTELYLEGERVEIEIISRGMEESNQYGILAHWKDRPDELADYYRTYLEQLDQIADAEELRMIDVLSYAQSDQIQVFSPKGDVFALPKGATVLDFAYSIHTDLGNHCIGAIVNPSQEPGIKANRRVPRERKLFHGECLNILTDPGVRPSREWLKQIVMAKSRIEIKRAVSQQNASKARRLGREVLARELEQFGEHMEEWVKKPEVQTALEYEKLEFDKFLQEIGLRKRAVGPFLKKHLLVDYEKIGRLRELLRSRPWNLFGSQSTRFLIESPEDPLLKMAECCRPIPGDKIVGFVNREMELEIHRNNCEEFSEIRQVQAREDMPLVVEWHLPRNETRPHNLKLNVVDGTGVLYQITKIIKAANVAIELSESKILPNNEASIHIQLEPITWNTYHKIMVGLRTLKFVNRIS